MVMLLFKGVALSDNEIIDKRIQPGDILDLQFKLASSLPPEYVTRDKQRALDLIFVLYSAKISKDEKLKKKVLDELTAFGKTKTGFSDIEAMFSELK